MNLNKLKEIIPDLNKINFSSLSPEKIETLNNIYKFYFENSKNFPSKKELRKKIKEERKKLTKQFIKEKSEIFCKKFLNSDYYKSANSIFCYISFNNEIITDQILKQTLKDKKKLGVPIIKDNEIFAAKIEDLTNFKENRYGILEPLNYTILDKDDIDITIVPALLFNPLGFRLGYGGGFYDRFLTDYKRISVGFILSQFCVDYFIPERFDKIVDILFIE